MIKLPFNNPNKAIVGILLVIGLFVAYKSCSATELEVGPTFTGQFNGGVGLVLTERVADNRIDLGVALVSDQTWDETSVTNNGNVFAAFVASKPESFWGWLPEEISIGATMWVKDNPPINGCRQGYLLGLKKRFRDFSVGIRHWSNSGICRPNRGQDLLTFGWRF